MNAKTASKFRLFTLAVVVVLATSCSKDPNQGKGKARTDTDPDKTIGDPVGLMTGAAVSAATDLFVETPDLPLLFRRGYSSRLSRDGTLGYGWTHGYADTVSVVTNGATVRLFVRALDSDGAPVIWRFERRTDGSFDSIQGLPLTPELHADGSVSLLEPGGIVRQFGADGLLDSVDLRGAPVLFCDYENRADPSARRLVRVRHRGGKALAFTYDANGRIVRVDSPDPSVFATFEYEQGVHVSLSAVVRTDGERTASCHYRYGAAPDGLPHDSVSVYGPWATNTCSDPGPGRLLVDDGSLSAGLLVQKTDPNGVSAYFAYGPDGDTSDSRAVYSAFDGGLYEVDLIPESGHVEVLESVGGRESRTDVYYDPAELRILGEVCDGIGSYREYDGNGDLVLFAAGDTNTMEGVVVRATYDGNHCPTNTGTGFNAEPVDFWSAEWDEDWRVPFIIRSPEGRETAWERNGRDILVFGAGTHSALDRAVLHCDELWRVTNAVDANGRSVAIVRDAAGYVARVESTGEPAVSFGYDSLGCVSSVSLPGPVGSVRTTAIANNAFGLPISVVHPDETAESWLYDGTWRHATNHVDALGRTDEIKWILGTPVLSSRRAADGTVIPLWSLKHDRQMNALAILDPLGRLAESYELDGNARVVSVTNLEGQVQRYFWMGADWLRRVERYDGSVVEFNPDTAGNLSRLSYPDETIRFRHDRDGLLTSASNSVGLVTNVYNEAAWLVSTTGADGTSVSYGYHPAGQVASVVSVAGETDYDLDEANRVSRIESPDASFDFGYGDWNGLATSITNDTGLVIEFAYDLRDRLTNIVYRSPSGAEIARFDYSLDPIGRITDRVVDVHVGGASRPRRAVFAYDDLDRLVSERVESAPFGTNPPPRQMTYAYDLAGNRLRKTDTASGVVDYVLGLGDRLASFTGGAYDFNPAGCVTNISGGASSPSEPLSRALAWNSQYQLVSVATNGVLAESYTWDPLGRRATTTTSEGTVRHVYDGNQCIADLDETGAVVRSYVWGPGIDNLLAIRVGEQTFYALTDHQNTVHGFVDATGSLVAHFVYDAWGNVLESSVSVPALADNRYLFQGREYSWLTGLYNFRARWFDPATGRWLSKDPIGISGGIALYEFCDNSPICLTDPVGLDPLSIEKGRYIFEMYSGDSHFGGPHVHVFEKRTRNLLGRITPNGDIISSGSKGRIPNAALNAFKKVQAPFLTKAARGLGGASRLMPGLLPTLLFTPGTANATTIEDAVLEGLMPPPEGYVVIEGNLYRKDGDRLIQTFYWEIQPSHTRPNSQKGEK